MNRKDFMQLISAGFSDPKLLSKATADFYTRCKQRLLSKMDIIARAIENDEIPTGQSQYISIQTLQNSELVGCFIDVNELSMKAIEAINNSDDIIDYTDIHIEVLNHYTDSKVDLVLGDVFSQLGEASDSLTIAIEAFSSLASEVLSTASDFTNRINILIPNMTEQTMQVCNDVYQLISATESNTSYLYELVNDYFGIKQNMNRNESDPFQLGDPAIEQYTGVNPTVSLLSGLDWLGPVKWWVAIRKFQVDAIVGIGKWVWKGLASIGKWFVKTVDTTFVNPVDVETTGNTYEFFSNYSSILYDLSNPYDKGSLPGPVLMENLDEFFTDEKGNPRPIWFNFKTITYQATFQKLPGTSAGANGNKVLVFNRYIKPTNIHKFAEVLTTAGFLIDDDSSWGNIDWVKFARELQNTDLSCSKDASEKEIAASLVLTNLIDRWLTNIFSITTPYIGWDDRDGVSSDRCAQLMNEYMNQEIINQYMPGDIIRWIRKYNGMSVKPLHYGRMGIWYTDYDTQLNSDNTSITTYGSQTQILERILSDQVSNKDMLQLVCNFAVRGNGTNVHAPVYSPFDGKGWNTVAPGNIMNNVCTGTELGFAILLTHLFLSEDIKLVTDYNSTYEEFYYPHFQELYDGVYLAYSRGSLNINQNSNVKTDEQNLTAARNWMITAIVIVAAIAAAIYMGVTVTSLLKTCRLRQAQIDSNMFKIGEMLSSGADESEINTLYNSTAKLMKKNKLLGKLFGTTGYSLNAIIGQTVSDINLPSSQVNANLDPVMRLIKN